MVQPQLHTHQVKYFLMVFGLIQIVCTLTDMDTMFLLMHFTMDLRVINPNQLIHFQQVQVTQALI